MGLSWIFRRSNFSDIPEGGSVAALRFRRVLNCEFRPAGSWACTALPLYIHALAVVIEHRGFMAASLPNKNDGAPPSACRSFRTAPPGRCFGCWPRSPAALGRNLRFLHLPLAAPCCSLGNKGFAPRFSLPAALPARPHACGHANIARCNFTAASPLSRNDGAPPHTPAGT